MRNRRQADPHPPQSPKLRGWLLLAGLGIALLPLRLAEFIVADLLPAFSKDVWSLLTRPGTEAYHPLNAPILLFELVGNLVLLVGSIVLAVLFFQKRRLVPILAVSFLVFAFLFYVGDYFVARQLPAVTSQEDMESKLDLAGALLVCAVGVPYFLVSRRVKETFVR
ncbi:MAG: DUF2569 domain-containing protein [Nitrospiraceae bacterium]